LNGAIAAPVVKNRSAIVEPRAFGDLLRAIAAYQGAPETVSALELLALTFVRPGELRSAEWSEFDLDGALSSIPAEKMKMRPAASRTDFAARHYGPSRSPYYYGQGPVRIPISAESQTLHEREHHQRRATKAWLQAGRDYGPWLSFGRLVHPQRERPMLHRKHREALIEIIPDMTTEVICIVL
jgi:integrase